MKALAIAATGMAAQQTNVATSNYCEDLAIDTGSGNPGAVGLGEALCEGADQCGGVAVTGCSNLN